MSGVARRTLVLAMGMAAFIGGAAHVRAQLPVPETAEPPAAAGEAVELTPVQRIAQLTHERLHADVEAMRRFRPAYPFWRHVYEIPDGRIAFGRADDGRLLAVLPTGSDWFARARWVEPTLADLFRGVELTGSAEQRREQIAQLLAQAAGDVVHNPTRGRFVLPNVERYGSFIGEWSAIYERFGVPAEVGLAQALVESGLAGTVRSEARAIGLCQWLESNWRVLNRLAPHVIEAGNQTTQAPYCAAYLAILATKYGSYVPALSEHHAGGTNVGRTLINGARLGGTDVVSSYFLGSRFALDARALSERRYSELYRTYGPRSFRYTELVFANLDAVAQLRASRAQSPVHAMRTTRSIPISELTRRTGLTAAELKRYNPALVRQVPARATVYLPKRVPALGADVTFWHRPAPAEFAAALADFLSLDVPADQWDEAPFERVLRDFQQRFTRTRSEEGAVMATMLAFVIQDMRTSGRAAILREFRTSPAIAQLFDEAAAALAAQ